ncbi:MAG: hypothetical protein K9L84_05265 [Candidatus Omnitrophica bacterium]|nr:hypothetical protein [Candidatus Omnitrophota bacterium]MCF7894452.1 hypothetical protein [Candidatus Omnitrophota bacterium]
MKLLLFTTLVLFLSACVQMRDYTGKKEGAFGLDIKQGIGEGEIKKDYYLTKRKEVIIQGYSKKEVIASLGYPDKITTSLEGNEIWRYEDKKLEIIFYREKVDGWNEL